MDNHQDLQPATIQSFNPCRVSVRVSIRVCVCTCKFTTVKWSSIHVCNSSANAYVHVPYHASAPSRRSAVLLTSYSTEQEIGQNQACQQLPLHLIIVKEVPNWGGVPPPLLRMSACKIPTTPLSMMAPQGHQMNNDVGATLHDDSLKASDSNLLQDRSKEEYLKESLQLQEQKNPITPVWDIRQTVWVCLIHDVR